MNKIISIFHAFIVINIVRVISPFLLLPVLTKFLPPKDYGILALYDASILILVPLVLLNSTSLISAKFYKSEKKYIAEVNTASMLVAIISCVILMVLILLIGIKDGAYINWGGSFVLLLPLFVLGRAVNTFVVNFLQTQHRVKLFGYISIGTLFFDLSLSLLLVAGLSQGFQGRLIASSIAFSLFGLYGVWLIKRDLLFSSIIIQKRIIEIVKFGLPLVPHALGGVSLAVAGRYLVAYMLGPKDAGVYALGYQVGSIMLLVGTSINQAWSVLLFKWLGEGVNKNKIMIRKVMVTLFFLLVAAVVMLWFCRDIIFWILSNHHFEVAKQLYPFMLIGFFFQSLYFLVVNFDFYEEKTGAIGSTTIFIALLSIILCYILVKMYGLIGAGYSFAFGMFCYFTIVSIRVIVFNRMFREVWF